MSAENLGVASSWVFLVKQIFYHRIWEYVTIKGQFRMKCVFGIVYFSHKPVLWKNACWLKINTHGMSTALLRFYDVLILKYILPLTLSTAAHCSAPKDTLNNPKSLNLTKPNDQSFSAAFLGGFWSHLQEKAFGWPNTQWVHKNFYLS